LGLDVVNVALYSIYLLLGDVIALPDTVNSALHADHEPSGTATLPVRVAIVTSVLAGSVSVQLIVPHDAVAPASKMLDSYVPLVL
jgi:hypothetical protein